MKNKIAVAILLLLAVFYSCKKSKSTVAPAVVPGSQYTAQLAGAWHWSVSYQISTSEPFLHDTAFGYTENDSIMVMNDTSIVFRDYVLHIRSYDSLAKTITFYDANYDPYFGGAILTYYYSDTAVSCSIHHHDGASTDEYYRYNSL